MQTSYTQNMPVGKVGGIADSAMVQDIETFKNPDGAAFHGCVVTRGANSGEIVHPDAAGEITDEKLVKGVVIATHEQEIIDNGLGPAYPIKSVVPVMRKGRVWVTAEDTITEGTSTVNVRYAGTGQKGALRGALVTSETAVLPKAKWKTSTAGNGALAILEIDL